MRDIENMHEAGAVIQEREVSLLQSMRDGRKSYPAVYIKFTQYKDYYATHAFCFYEGEDAAYYDSRVERFLNDGNRFITLIAGNKEAVLKAMKTICQDPAYASVRKMFFVDRDYDAPQPSHPDLFETDGYSVENYYVEDATFCRVLQSAFHINEADASYQPCLNACRETFNQFHEVIRPFNARVLYQHRYEPQNKDCCFSSISNTHLAKIQIGGVERGNRYNEELAKIDQVLNIDYAVLTQIEEELCAEPVPRRTYRGKNELYCLTALLEKLRDAYNSNTEDSVFLDKQKRKIKLPVSNHPLLTLSQFANTPQALADFIASHRPLSA